VIKSADGTVEIDILNNKVVVATKSDSGTNGKIELSAVGIVGYGWDSDKGNFVRSLRIMPGDQGGGSAGLTSVSSSEGDGGISISAPKLGAAVIIGHSMGEVRVNGKTIMINGKTVSWKDNGDGTFTLIGQ
jgi:hypothetical protein